MLNRFIIAHTTTFVKRMKIFWSFYYITVVNRQKKENVSAFRFVLSFSYMGELYSSMSFTGIKRLRSGWASLQRASLL